MEESLNHPDNSLADDSPQDELIPLQPHRYPIRILVFFGFFLLIFVWNLSDMPGLIAALASEKKGDRKLEAKDYPAAAAYYEKATSYTNSTELRKKLIIALLKTRTKESVNKAFTVLAFTKLTPVQEVDVKAAIPGEDELRQLVSEKINQ